jgi:glycosyltransferase involved in cell wall biosynthesis
MNLSNYPKISIVTPNFNGSKFLEETILSVISQGYPNLEYIIIDGCSTDESIDIIKKYENNIISWISEPDNGMYDAIQKGFERCTGEILGWINSDDVLQKKSLYTIADIFTNNTQIKWVQGYPTVIDEIGRIVYHRPPRFSKYEFYLKDFHDGIFIQQESTFWTRDLWIKSGGSFSNKYKYAGDFDLWMKFFRVADLYCTNSILGSFRSHSFGQISKNLYNLYIQECDQIISEAVTELSDNEKKILRKLQFNRSIGKKFPRVFNLLKLGTLEHRFRTDSLSVDYDSSLKLYSAKA